MINGQAARWDSRWSRPRIDFGPSLGHRNDALGFNKALRDFDAALPALTAALREDDLLFITAHHGNDLTTGPTDHAREHVPLTGAVARGAVRADSLLPLVVGT